MPDQPCEAMSYDEAAQHLVKTDPRFAVSEQQVRGATYRVFANAPDHTRALLQDSREIHGNGALDYLVFAGERWTYEEFCRDIRRVAHVLDADLAVRKGQPVAVAMRNCPEMLILMMAISSLGAVVTFMNAWWTAEELDYALGDSGARLVFADADRMARMKGLERARELQLVGVRMPEGQDCTRYEDLIAGCDDADWPQTPIDTDDDFAIMYSSGTTGHPKGVVLTHRGAMNAVSTWLMQSAMAPLIEPPAPDAPPPPRPSYLIATPLFHVTATHPVFLLSLPAGAKISVMAKWDAEEAVRLIRDEQITRLIGVPTQCADLMVAADKMGEALDCLEFLGSGGATRPPSQVGELADRFPNASIATGWGMTETNANGIGMAGPDYTERPGIAGRLYPPVQELRFLDDNGQDVEPGEVGEITVKSPCNMRCYLNKPEATDDVFRDGWLRTGDMGRIDAEGYVTIVDRKKNIIIRGGENIACLDVEAALHRHPAVAEACAFPVPHDRLGEVVGAAVQIRAGHTATAEEITGFLADHIARFKIPEHLWLQGDPLLRGATDKLDRRGLRAACLKKLEEHNENA